MADAVSLQTIADESHLPFAQQSLVFRLLKRAEIRRQSQERVSVQEGRPDRLADLLEEAGRELVALQEDAANYRALRGCTRLRIMGYAGNISPGDRSQAPAGHVHLGLELWSHHPETTEQRSLDIFDRFVAILRGQPSRQ
jgi:hypothetical protein